MVLNRRDKEQLVIDLHGQGKTIREIASAAHLSFSDIGTPRIRKHYGYFQLVKNLLRLQ